MRKLAVMTLALAAVAAFAGFQTTAEAGKDKNKNAVTITGTSGCASCEGVASTHDIYLTTESGIRIVLQKTKHSSESYGKAHRVRKDGKTMTAVLMGPIMSKGEGQDAYLVAKTRKIKIEG